MGASSETVEVGGTALLGLQPSKVAASRLLIPGRWDFGVERAVSDLCSANVSRYANRMDDEATKQFFWSGLSAWERDFKEGGTV